MDMWKFTSTLLTSNQIYCTNKPKESVRPERTLSFKLFECNEKADSFLFVRLRSAVYARRMQQQAQTYASPGVPLRADSRGHDKDAGHLRRVHEDAQGR